MATIRIPTSAGPMPLFITAPPSDAQAAVIVVQEAFGVNAHIEDVAGRLAAAGYRAVAPHLFHRTGDPTIAYDDLPGAMSQVRNLTARGLVEDLDATLDYLADKGLPADGVGIVGFCVGGSITLFAAAHRRLGAAVTFYGGGISTGRMEMPPLVEVAPELQTPWFGMFGDRDQTIAVSDVEALRAAAAKAPVATEVVRYPDAGHAFHCDARPSTYHEAAAKDGWARTLAWFAKWLPGQPSRNADEVS